MVQIIAVLEFPPKAVCKIRVSLLSRKLIKVFPPFAELSLLITFESASKLRLIFEPSLSLNPSACVRLAPSLPAKSTRFN